MPTCKGCNASINWMRTEGGAYMPLNPGKVIVRYPPLPDQPTVTIITRDGRTILGSPIAEDAAESTRKAGIRVAIGAESHWSTCPKQDVFRKRRNRLKGHS